MRLRINIIALLTAAILCGCADKTFTDGALKINEGELTECRLGLTVGDFDVASGGDTRADGETYTTATDAEKRIDNIWVFQYGDDTDKTLLIKPRYYDSTSQNTTDGSWNIVLNDSKSTVYVVTNTANDTWAATGEGFETLDALKKQTLPTPYSIKVGTGDGYVDADEVSIPMSGSTTIEESEIYKNNIKVPVERMYAKIILRSKLLKDMSLKGLEINGIPFFCQIEPLSTNPTQATAATYPTDTRFITNSFSTPKDNVSPVDETYNLSSDYIIYVPENIQGVNSTYLENGETKKGRDYDGPTNALVVKYHLDIKDGSSNVDGSAMMYPGANDTNNFNVNRNYVYNVTANFNSKDYFFPTPSSNCFIIKPGATLKFWPYFRTETGGGYSFKDYLDPTVESKKITGLKIIWQDYDVIGDNTNGDKVKISDAASEYTTYDDIIRKFTIEVVTNKEGNALIGAYNANGDIIWSWHIWVTDNEPDNVANAIRYTTYSWDSKGIKANSKDPYSATRVPGYQVMPCNLGAKEFEPTSGDPTVTYGPLYQWGRKDPFPAMKVKDKILNMQKYNASTGVEVYDNANKKIEMPDAAPTVNNTANYLFKTVSCTSTSTATDEAAQRADGLKYSINNPTVFISATNVDALSSNTGASNYYNKSTNYENNGDWLLGHDDKLWGGEKPTSTMTYYKIDMANAGGTPDYDQTAYVWDNYGSEKTIFDPCPTGWRVPPSDLWMGFTSTGQSIHQSNKSFDDFFLPKVNTIDTNTEINNNNGYYMFLDGWKTKTVNKTFFPTPGLRLADGEPFHLSICGNYHNATSAPMIDTKGTYVKMGEIYYNDRVNCLHFHSQTSINQVNVFERQRLFVYKAIAGPIRCVRDKL